MDPDRILICGAGIAGIATAQALAEQGATGIVVADCGPPMGLTTSRSGENFRDYWPDACMAALSRHSIERMAELARAHPDRFELHFSGYRFISRHPGRRIFPSAMDDGQVLLDDAPDIRRRMPYLDERVRQVLECQPAGHFDVHGLGSLLLSEARRRGARLVRARVDRLEPLPGGGYRATLEDHPDLRVEQVVVATGPFVNDLLAPLGRTLPVKSILQRKFVMPDPERVVPRDMPFTIIADPIEIDFDAEERALLADDPDFAWMLDPLPGGLHVKPEGGDRIKLGWAINRQSESPRWDPEDDPAFPGLVLRGASQYLPGLAAYVDDTPTPLRQFAGYYTRTEENWPLIGPLGDDLFTVAALSGFGTMTACAAGDLCARWITGRPLPDHARYFHPDRLQDAVVRAAIEASVGDGQL